MSNLKQLVLKIISDYYKGEHIDLITRQSALPTNIIMEDDLRYYVFLVLKYEYSIEYRTLLTIDRSNDISRIFKLLNIDD